MILSSSLLQKCLWRSSCFFLKATAKIRYVLKPHGFSNLFDCLGGILHQRDRLRDLQIVNVRDGGLARDSLEDAAKMWLADITPLRQL